MKKDVLRAPRRKRTFHENYTHIVSIKLIKCPLLKNVDIAKSFQFRPFGPLLYNFAMWLEKPYKGKLGSISKKKEKKTQKKLDQILLLKVRTYF